jgi:hypothetical protein
MTGGADWSTGSRRVCGSYVDGTIGCVVCVGCGGLTLGLTLAKHLVNITSDLVSLGPNIL